jgi:peroxiredoxin family protein
MQVIDTESGRADAFLKQLEAITFQISKISMFATYPCHMICELLQSKSLDLMTEIIEYISAALKYFSHGLGGK